MQNQLQNPQKPPGMLSVGMVVITSLSAFWAGLFPIRSSNDPWWHLKTGEYLWNYFAEHGFLAFPQYDVFTFTGANEPWINHQWLGELIFYASYLLGGLQGAIALKAFIFAAVITTLMFYIRRLGANWPLAAVGGAVAIFASQTTLYLRPLVLSYLFFVIFWHLLLNLHRKKHVTWTIVAMILLELLWINVHGGGVLGILLVFFWLVHQSGQHLIAWLKGDSEQLFGPQLQQALILFCGVFLVSFINPFTYHTHFLTSKVMGDVFLLRNIGELQSPNFHYTNAFEAIILGLFFILMLRRVSIQSYEILAVIFFAHQAINFIRHIPLFALTATPVVIKALAETRQDFFASLKPSSTEETNSVRPRINQWVQFIGSNHLEIVLVFLLAMYFFGFSPGKILQRNIYDLPDYITDGYVRSSYPVEAVDFIIFHDIQGPMFNDDNFAGYLIYRLSPEIMKVYTDSRFDLWGSRFAKEELATYNAQEIPLGYYTTDGMWHSIPRDWSRDEIGAYLNQAMMAGNIEQDFVNWYESDLPYWKYVLNKYDFNLIILYANYPLDRHLKQNWEGWYLVFDKSGYVIHLRDKAENKDLIERYALKHRSQIEP